MQTLPPSGMPEVCKVLVVQAGFPALRSEKDKWVIGKRGGAIHVVRTQESHGSLSPPVAPQCDRTKQTRIVPAVLSPFCLVRAMACKLFCSDSGCRHRERWGDRGSSSHHRTCPYLCLITTLPHLSLSLEMSDINFRKIDIDAYDEDVLVETELYDTDPRDPAQALNDAKQKATAVRSALSK